MSVIPAFLGASHPALHALVPDMWRAARLEHAGVRLDAGGKTRPLENEAICVCVCVGGSSACKILS